MTSSCEKCRLQSSEYPTREAVVSNSAPEEHRLGACFRCHPTNILDFHNELVIKPFDKLQLFRIMQAYVRMQFWTICLLTYSLLFSF